MAEQANSLSRDAILSALALLDSKLEKEGIIGELCLFGGAAMVLAFDARENTRDVDGIFVPKQKLANEGLPQHSHLRLLRPTASYLLAMKCLAARVGGYDTASDAQDVMTLCEHLKLSRAEDILSVVSQFYPDSVIPVKTRFFVEELFQ